MHTSHVSRQELSDFGDGVSISFFPSFLFFFGFFSYTYGFSLFDARPGRIVQQIGSSLSVKLKGFLQKKRKRKNRKEKERKGNSVLINS